MDIRSSHLGFSGYVMLRIHRSSIKETIIACRHFFILNEILHTISLVNYLLAFKILQLQYIIKHNLDFIARVSCLELLSKANVNIEKAKM